MKPGPLSPIILTGKTVTLKPMNLSRDIPILYKLSDGSPISTKTHSIPAYDAKEVLWKYFSWDNFESAKQMKDYYKNCLAYSDIKLFTLFDNESYQPIGSLGYGYICPEKFTVEIVTVWVSPIAQGAGKCSEAVYLMIEHAFSVGYKFVNWGCYPENIRSRRMAERFGFKIKKYEEGYAIKGLDWFDLILFEIEQCDWELRKRGPCWWGI